LEANKKNHQYFLTSNENLKDRWQPKRQEFLTPNVTFSYIPISRKEQYSISQFKFKFGAPQPL